MGEHVAGRAILLKAETVGTEEVQDEEERE
jgi:hypothetical protein